MIICSVQPVDSVLFTFFNFNFARAPEVSIHHCHIDHNEPCLPSKICITFFSNFSVVPRENEDNRYAKFWGVNKVHYGLCENGK